MSELDPLVVGVSQSPDNVVIMMINTSHTHLLYLLHPPPSIPVQLKCNLQWFITRYSYKTTFWSFFHLQISLLLLHYPWCQKWTRIVRNCRHLHHCIHWNYIRNCINIKWEVARICQLLISLLLPVAMLNTVNISTLPPSISSTNNECIDNRHIEDRF